jgi:uncharacterized membrane protein (DUF4010 family)
MDSLPPLLIGFLVALGLGLLIGIDRERHKGEGATRQAPGLRTFTLAALAGATAMAAGGTVLLGAAALAMTAFAAISYWQARDADPGMTTETALVLTTLLGGLAIGEPIFAAGLGVVVAALLAARPALHRFVLSVLTDEEIRSLLIFAGATLVVLPLLPSRAIGPYGALNPRTIWIVVILVMAVGALGHIAVRALGARFGLPLAGLASGFVSSVATIAAMGRRAEEEPELLRPAIAGATLSSIATVVQLAILIGVTSPATLAACWPPLLCAGVAACLLGGGYTLWALRRTAQEHAAAGEAFSLRTALVFALILSVVLLAAAAAQHWMGETGVVIAAAVSGLADTHSAGVSVASLVADGRIEPSRAVVPVLAAFSANTLTKSAFAIGAGSRSFALNVVPGLVLMALAAWAGTLVAGLAKL